MSAPDQSRCPATTTSLVGATSDSAPDAEALSADEIEGVLNAACVIIGCTRSELTAKIRGERRGGDGENTQPLSVPDTPTDEP